MWMAHTNQGFSAETYSDANSRFSLAHSCAFLPSPRDLEFTQHVVDHRLACQKRERQWLSQAALSEKAVTARCVEGIPM